MARIPEWPILMEGIFQFTACVKKKATSEILDQGAFEPQVPFSEWINDPSGRKLPETALVYKKCGSRLSIHQPVIGL